MKSFEILHEGGEKIIKAKAATRAGLAIASLQGLSAVTGGTTSELDEKVERPFSVEAGNYGALLSALLGKAIEQGSANGESYDDISFSLITEKKAEGAFIGRPVKGAKAPSAATAKGDAARNEAGEWEATIAIE